MHGVAGDIASCVVARYLLMLVSDVTSADVNLSDFVYTAFERLVFESRVDCDTSCFRQCLSP